MKNFGILASSPLFVLLLLYSSACNSSGFKGNQKTTQDTPKSKEGDQSAAVQPSNDNIVVEGCNEAIDAITQASLLSDSIQNGNENQWISYELFLTDCDGKIKAFEDKIAFDINAVFTPFGEDLIYEIKDAEGGKLLHQGALNFRSGKDLFGNIGDQYGYYEASDWTMSGQVSKIHLNINFSGLTVQPGGTDPILSDSYDLPSYLRIGESTPVQRNIKFINNP